MDYLRYPSGPIGRTISVPLPITPFVRDATIVIDVDVVIGHRGVRAHQRDQGVRGLVVVTGQRLLWRGRRRRPALRDRPSSSFHGREVVDV
jgi:hypothetical protein